MTGGPEPTAADRRSAPLDGVRALGSLGVLAFHAHLSHTRGGLLGVDVFFVLSGYLITTLLLRELARRGRVSLGRFWIRRAVRLWPPLAVLLLLCAFDAKGLGTGGTIAGFLRDAVNAGTWSMDVVVSRRPQQPPPLEHTWSLAVEEQFYLVWPLVLLTLITVLKLTDRRRLALVAGLFGVASWVLLVTTWDGLGPLGNAYTRPDTRALPILCGCALALLADLDPRAHLPSWCARPWTGVSGLVIVLATYAFITHHATSFERIIASGTVLATLGSLLLIAHCVTAERGVTVAVFGSRPLAFAGVVSYSTYLVQNPLGSVLHRHHRFAGTALRDELATAGLCLVAGVVLWWAVERPVRQLLTSEWFARETDPDAHREGRRRSAYLAAAAVPATFVIVGVILAIHWNPLAHGPLTVVGGR
ncbi:MAG TPA: acyltransferase [Mycobacteriales bacterium]|nr:acyltransferase [Mycobacteriales bacterium]